MRRILSYALVAAGAILLFQGSRLLLEWRLGQSQAAGEFEDNSQAPDNGRPLKPLPGDAIAKLSIPRLSAELYVIEGDDASELRRGPGHMSGTAMPGDPGNCVIAGHRDTHFRVLKDIRRGDEIILQTRWGQFLYQVSSLSVVSPKDTRALQPTSDSELHLITCYPFYYVGAAPERFVVRAQLAGSVSADSDQVHGTVGARAAGG